MTSGRRILWRFVGIAFVAAALAFIVLRLSDDWEAALEALESYSVWSILGSGLSAMAGLGMTAIAWRRLVGGLGYPVSMVSAFGVFFVSQIGKYLPGSVWPYLAQARLGRAIGIPGPRAIQAGLTLVLLQLLTGVVVGAPRLLLGEGLDARFAFVLLAIPAVLLVVHPRVTSWLVTRAGKILRTQVTPTAPSWSALAVAAASVLAAWLFWGVSLAALVAPLQDLEPGDLPALASSYALSWSVGFIAAAVLFVAAPAGLGFREVALFATLAGVIGSGAAGVVVLLSRVIMTLADVVWALLAGRATGMRWDGRPGGRGDGSRSPVRPSS